MIVSPSSFYEFIDMVDLIIQCLNPGKNRDSNGTKMLTVDKRQLNKFL